MKKKTEKFRPKTLDVPFVRPKSAGHTLIQRLTRPLIRFVRSIVFKLTLLMTGLVALTAFGISVVVINIMDDIQLQSMIQRGAAVSQAIASPAAYNILADDRLALDNLVARISATQGDLDYIAIIDNQGTILAHSMVEKGDTLFAENAGTLIVNNPDMEISKVLHGEGASYEFSLPIEFADKIVGKVVTGLGAESLEASKIEARTRILSLTALILPLAILGAYVLSRRFTSPVKQLYDGVCRLESGEEDVTVPARSNDELATLTRSFNSMSRQLLAQKRNLINYSEELERSYTDIVRILAAALDARDNYTYGHSSRVARLSVSVGRKLDLKPYELKDLELSCLLHDIGKIRVPDAILNKPERLSKEEYQYIKDHPLHGTEILELAESLKKYIPAVRHHHEWHDGSGYPDQLAGEQIPLYARILSIADAYDAMTSSRPYRKGLSREIAVAELEQFKGSQFQPDMVDIFIETLNEYGDSCDLPLALEGLF